MNAAEIRADLVNELRAAAEGYQSLGVRNMQIAGMCRDLAAQHRAQAAQIESTIFSKSPNATGRADESTAEPVDFKLNGAASSSAPNFTTDKAESRKQKVEMECAA